MIEKELTFDDCRGWPEFEACMPIFEESARLNRRQVAGSTYDIGGVFRFYFTDLKATIRKNGPFSTWRSSVYGKKDAAEKLAALVQRMGCAAIVSQKYGTDDTDWAVTVTAVAETK